MMSHPQSSTEGEAVATQHEKSNRKSNLLLWALLAAVLIIIYRLAFDKIRTNKTLQTLKEEKGALRRNISDHVCLKLDRNWEKHGDKCYLFNDRHLPWEGSRSFCEVLGADLVKIDSREEQEFLVEKGKNFVKGGWDSFWIGLKDSGVEGNWTWVDGSPMNSSMKFWKDGEPNFYLLPVVSGENCVRILMMGGAEGVNTWIRDACVYARKSICEKPAGTGPSSSVCG